MKNRFFEGWSCLKLIIWDWHKVQTWNFTPVWLKGLKLKARKFRGRIPTFSEVTGEKLLGRGDFVVPPILNRVNNANYTNFFECQQLLPEGLEVLGAQFFTELILRKYKFGNFTLKQEIQFRKIFWLWGFLTESSWLLGKSKTKYLNWVFHSSSVQRAKTSQILFKVLSKL